MQIQIIGNQLFMSGPKERIVAQLWQEFCDKIKSDWTVKYKRYGSFEPFDQMKGKISFVESVLRDMEKQLDTKSPAMRLPSKDRLNAYFNAGKLSKDVNISLLDAIAVYLGHKSWYVYESTHKHNELPFALPINNIATFEIFGSDKALKELASRLPRAKKVYNTRIPGKDVNLYLQKQSAAWREAVRHFVAEPKHLFVEVLGQALKNDASNLIGSPGYKPFCFPCALTSFLNFIILEYKDGTKEVWIGWVINPLSILEQPCFVFTDDSIVQLFHGWFKDLLNDCEEITK